MSDEKNVNGWHPPMKAPEGSSRTFLDMMHFPAKPSWVTAKLFDFNNPQKKKVKTETPKQKSSAKAIKLHDDWKRVMIAESKVPTKIFKPDPNISQEFFDKLEAMAKRLNCNFEDLAAIMYRESHFDPSVKDAATGTYAGLIQMDETAFKNAVKYSLKTHGKKSKVDPNMTYDKYRKLSREKQLDYAEAYLEQRISEAKKNGKIPQGKISGGMIYALIHVPSHVNGERKDITEDKRRKVIAEHQVKVDKAKRVPNQFKHISVKS